MFAGVGAHGAVTERLGQAGEGAQAMAPLERKPLPLPPHLVVVGPCCDEAANAALMAEPSAR